MVFKEAHTRQATVTQRNKIPIIFSQCGYSNVGAADVEGYIQSLEERPSKAFQFLGWLVTNDCVDFRFPVFFSQGRTLCHQAQNR